MKHAVDPCLLYRWVLNGIGVDPLSVVEADTPTAIAGWCGAKFGPQEPSHAETGSAAGAYAVRLYRSVLKSMILLC
jgi:hypothetical protein